MVSEGAMSGPHLLDDDEFASNLDRLRAEALTHSHPAQRQGVRDGENEEVGEGAESLEGDAIQRSRRFSLECPYIGCDYSTITLNDPKQVGYLVKLLSLHTQGQNTGDEGSENSDNKDSLRSDREAKELAELGSWPKGKEFPEE